MENAKLKFEDPDDYVRGLEETIELQARQIRALKDRIVELGRAWESREAELGQSWDALQATLADEVRQRDELRARIVELEEEAVDRHNEQIEARERAEQLTEHRDDDGSTS